MSNIFCGTLKIHCQGFIHRKQDDLGLQLYRIEVSKFQELVLSLKDFLAPFERDRANGYHFVKDKNRFIICRVVLKFLLAEQTGLDIDKIFLDNHHNQKPYLPSHPSIYFNITHADDCAIIAISKNSVGVDIEYVNKNFDYKEILQSIFNTSEIDEIFSSDHHHLTFYRLWTRKEAIVKATGKGIDENILEIISLDGHHHIDPKLLDTIKNLQVFSFELDKNYIGAVAFPKLSKSIDKLLCYTIPPTFQELLIN